MSDAVEPSSKYLSMRRNNGYLRRPEILETVYSVEEDGDQDSVETTENTEYDERTAKSVGSAKGRLQDLYGSFERLAQETESPPHERPRDESQQAQVHNFLHFILKQFFNREILNKIQCYISIQQCF